MGRDYSKTERNGKDSFYRVHHFQPCLVGMSRDGIGWDEMGRAVPHALVCTAFTLM